MAGGTLNNLACKHAPRCHCAHFACDANGAKRETKKRCVGCGPPCVIDVLVDAQRARGAAAAPTLFHMPSSVRRPVTTTAPRESVASEAGGPDEQPRVRWMISKRDFRARAHSNPLNDGLFEPPLTPSELQMDKLFANPPSPKVDWCDIGCGYGGLLATLSTAFPDKVMLGLEIRDRVTQFCRQRVQEMRQHYPGSYGNVAFERTNAMKFLPNYFAKGSLQKLFFCYPDPHFKRKKNRQRIISTQLLAEYAYVLEEGTGVAYVVTDVPELFEWMVSHFEAHPLFERRSEREHSEDAVSRYVRDMTDEAQRVEKSDRNKQDASFRRLPNP